MIKKFLLVALLALYASVSMAQKVLKTEKWKLVWSDEFNKNGAPDPKYWSYEEGFVRNKEPQWYQAGNAVCKGGNLILEARAEVVENPKYDPESKDWKVNRKEALYTSSSVITKGKFDFLYGRLEVRAKIPTCGGAWPAIWTKGREMPWPHCGEIDILEFYMKRDVQSIWANTAWGGDKAGQDVWDAVTTPFAHFTDKAPKWADKYHVWRMDWDEQYIRLYLDDELLNQTALEKTENGEFAKGTNPFKQPHFILLNLALKNTQWDNPKDSKFPIRYEIDYVRVYQKVVAK